MNFDNYTKAGEIAREVKEFAKTVVKVDASILEATEKVEKKIIDLGGKIAFPVDMSINNIAAHYSAIFNDKSIFTSNDLVKVDLGVHIEGYVVDTAVSIDLSGKYEDLIEASKAALNDAIKSIHPGVKVCDVGKEIEKAIKEFGFNPIKNLSGHGLGLYEIHSSPSIPNFNNGDTTKLTEDQIIAIEPFATNGPGLVFEGKPSEIFMLIAKKNTRDISSRKLLAFIEKEYSTLPFTKRWLMKFDIKNVQFALRNLEKEKILHQFPVLPEKGDGIVSQSEHTIIVKDKPIVLS